MSVDRHPIEDTVITNFFHFLWKRKNNLPEHESNGVTLRIPNTVCYEHNFPKGWYCTSQNGIMRRTGKDIDTKAVCEAMSKSPTRGMSSVESEGSKASGRKAPPVSPSAAADDDGNGEIVAMYLEKRHGAKDDVFSLEYLNRKGLREFLTRGSSKGEEIEYATKPRNGFLQQFIRPHGGHNSLIQVVWSRHLCLIEKRQNIHPLYPTARAASAQQLSLWERAVTYQGPSSYSCQAYVAPNVISSIKAACHEIVTHFMEIEHRAIDRMVLYFKTDADCNLWLLWCSAIRLSGTAHGPLVPKFSLPSTRKCAASLDFLTQNDKQVLLSETRSLGLFGPSGDSQHVARPEKSRFHLMRKPFTAPQHGLALINAGLSSLPQQRKGPLRRLSSLIQAIASDSDCNPDDSPTSHSRVDDRPAESRVPQPTRHGKSKPAAALPVLKPPGLVMELRDVCQLASDISTSLRAAVRDPILWAEVAQVPSLREGLAAHAVSMEDAIEWLDSMLYEVYSHFLQQSSSKNIQVPPTVLQEFPEIIEHLEEDGTVEMMDIDEVELLFEEAGKTYNGELFLTISTGVKLCKMRNSVNTVKRTVLGKEHVFFRKKAVRILSASQAVVTAVLAVVQLL
eukprot:Sspe_Gene.86769::Locus_57538_Transcript_1_1_Confidence_1.000_Length_2085::g.86769::m.86769